MGEWDWDHLRYFLALARNPKLQRAADRLGVSHTTVLRRIRAFEDQLATRLFERTPDGWLMSVAGERLLLEVEKMESALGTISREIVGSDQRIEGPVVITTLGLIAGLVLPPVLVKLKQRHPHVQIQLRVGSALVDLQRREADIAIRVTASPPPTLVGRRIGQKEVTPCASAEYLRARPEPVFPVDPSSEHHYILDVSHSDESARRWLAPVVGTSRVTEVDCMATAMALCGAGLGVAVLPQFVARGAGLVLLEPPEPVQPMSVWILTHPDLRNVARVRAVMAALGDELQGVFAAADPQPAAERIAS